MQSILSRYSSILAVLLLLFVSSYSFAANNPAGASASVSKNRVAKSEVFQLRIVVNQKVSQDDIDLSVLEKDFFMSRPSFGTSINIINGDRNNRSEWNVSLAAQKLGTLTIPSFTVAGVKTQPISINVRMDENQPKASDLVELRSRLSTTSLYPKESAILDFRLIIKADPRRLQNAQIVQPIIEGMSIDLEGEPNQYQTIKDGVEVTIVDQKYRIDALQSGEFTLTAPAFTGTVIYGDNRYGTTSMITADTAAEQFKLTVHPKPANYSGTWLPTKNLAFNQQWLNQDGQPISDANSHNMQVGDALTRIVTLQIEGLNPNQFPNLAINYPSAFRVYDEKPQFSQSNNGDTIMTLKQVLIPQQVGEQTLSEVSINWWDSRNKQQQTSLLKGLDVVIDEATGLNNTQIISPIATPTQPVSVVYDRGIWPYLTALFAALWLISTVYIVRSRHALKNRVHDNSTEHKEDSSTLTKLKAALKQQDVIKSQLYLSKWQTEHAPLSEQEEKLIQQYNEKLGSKYNTTSGATPSKTDDKELLKLMKNVEKRKPSTDDILNKL
ncbi:BatD family protein [Vibrio lamellibrachiae]|uniref:BatD family protein n=1 Tax=Vibrio lamellibrachiae TaxID=2910253 RepID=UPI003D0EBEEC